MIKGWWKKRIDVLSPLEGYNKWAATYQHESNPIKNFSDDFIERNLPDLKGKLFLDAGCGTGKFCALAESQLAAKVVGFDLSQPMLDVARTLCPETELRCIDLNTANIEKNNYDIIVCALVLGHIQYLTVALTNLVDALKVGGIMIITDFHPFLTMRHAKRTFKDSNSGKSFEVKHYLHLFEDYFKTIKDSAIVEKLEEPQFNNTPVVFGMVIRKIK